MQQQLQHQQQVIMHYFMVYFAVHINAGGSQYCILHTYATIYVTLLNIGHINECCSLIPNKLQHPMLKPVQTWHNRHLNSA